MEMCICGHRRYDHSARGCGYMHQVRQETALNRRGETEMTSPATPAARYRVRKPNRRDRPDLVRYVSPFGSPATMPRDRARRLLDEDDARWLRYEQAEREGAGRLLSVEQRQVGPPRMVSVPR